MPPVSGYFFKSGAFFIWETHRILLLSLPLLSGLHSHTPPPIPLKTVTSCTRTKGAIDFWNSGSELCAQSVSASAPPSICLQRRREEPRKASLHPIFQSTRGGGTSHPWKGKGGQLPASLFGHCGVSAPPRLRPAAQAPGLDSPCGKAQGPTRKSAFPEGSSPSREQSLKGKRGPLFTATPCIARGEGGGGS